MNGPELMIAGIVAVAILCVAVKARGRSRRAASVAEIARLGVSPVPLIGRVLWTAALIVAVQWVVITRVAEPWALLVALAVPALVSATAVVRALTVTAVSPDASRTRRHR